MEKVKKKCALIILVGGLVVILCTVLFFAVSYVPETDVYSNYEVVDANLTWKNTGRMLGKYTAQEQEVSVNYKYKKIRGEDKDTFIGAWRQPDMLFSGGTNVILVSPNTALDVFKDWTVKEIELFLVDSYTNSKDSPFIDYEPSDIQRVTIANTDNEDIIDEFIMLMEEEPESAKISDDYLDEKPLPQNNVKRPLYCGIRIHFDDSDGIVWEARLRICNSDGVRRIFIERLLLDPCGEKVVFNEIGNHSELFKYLVKEFFQ